VADRSPSGPPCEHLSAEPAGARAAACEECGSDNRLRVCATCGHVGCCDSQEGHARVHFHESGHEVIRQLTADGFGFTWCYAHDRYLEPTA